MTGTRVRAGVLGALAGGILAAGALTSATAYASTGYTVDNTNPACSDTGPGTPAQPFCTIAAGARAAHAGDTVLVNAGTYPGTSVNPTNSGTAGSAITFSANRGVTISGGSRAFALSSRNYIVVSGFIITGTSSYGISVSGGSNVTLSGNTESYAGTPISSPAAGIYLSNLSGGLISGNVTHDNSAHGIYLTGSTTGVTVQGNTSYHNAYQYERNANGIDDIAPGNSIIANVTYANEDTGINIYSGGNNALVADNVTYDNGDHGIDDYNVTGGRIIGNTVYYNCTDGINVEGTSGNYNIENNVSMDNATGAIINPTPIAINPSTGAPYYTNTCNRRVGDIGVYDSAPATTTANYNLVYQSGRGAWYTWAGTAYSTQAALNAATGQEASGIFANPRFVNAAAWNFQLAEGSAAIDSADSLASGEQATDILGSARVDDPGTPNTGNPAGSYYDRGAYEYQPGGGTPTGPTAALTVTPGTGTAPLPVTADASASTAGSSPISSYSFNFGDGTTVGPQASATASHTYPAPGSYTVTVTVTDGNNLTSNATQTVTVNPAAVGPTAALTVTPGTGTAPLPVTADASASTAGSSPISSYSFNFGDGTTVGPQASATASHTYPAPGSYTVTLTVTDGNNLTSNATQTVTVNPAAAGPTAALTVTPGTGTAPLPVTADASASTAGSSPISSYSFNFGDGTTVGPQASATASHTYPAPGSYTVTVTVTDGNNLTSNATQTVTVNPAGSGPAKYVNQIATNYSTSSHTSGYVTVWRTGGVAPGDMIVASVQLTGTSATGSVSGTDSHGDTLRVASDTSDGAGDRLVTLYGIAVAGLGVNDRITITFPTASSYRITADEVSGVSSLDQESAASGTGSTFSSGATGTTSRSGEFVFAATATFGGTSVSWNSGWTGLENYTTGSNALGRAYQIPGATGSFTASGPASGTWIAEIVALS